jgi:integrase
MGSIFRQRGRSTWMLKYYRDGRPIFESSGTDIKDDAKTILRQREGAIADGRPVSNKMGRLRFDEAVKDVENDYTTNQRRSASNIETRIRLHLKPAFTGRRMSTITTADVRTYIAARLDAGAKPASINRELAILKRAFSLAIKAGTLAVKPHIPMLEERNVRTGFFEREQFEAIRDQLPEPWRPVMTVAFYTGWRVRSELLPLTWAHVDTKAQIFRLDAGTTKNTEGRTFPYGALAALKDVIRDQTTVRDALREKGIISPWLFPDAQGQRLPAFYDHVWDVARTAAGCPGRIPHDFRRTAVRNLVRAGVAEKTAMMLTGHKTRSVFDRYDIVNEDDLREAVTRLALAPTLGAAKSR